MKITHDQIQAAYDTAKKRGKITYITTVAQQVLDVVGECVEFVEAWRKWAGRGTHKKATWLCRRWNEKAKYCDLKSQYKYYVKNSKEDELADIWISLLTLSCVMGYDELEVETMYALSDVEQDMYHLMNVCTDLYGLNLFECFDIVNQLACRLNIDLELHVRAKMAYNAVRED